MRFKAPVLLLVIAVFVLSISVHAAPKKVVVRVPGGTTIQEVGLIIDASYDNKLDNLVPGYKIVTVALINQSLNIVPMDPEKDEWSIKIEGENRSRRVISDLRSRDPEAWMRLPDKVKVLVGYPLMLPVGATEAVDLFVPNSVPVEKFNELIFYSKSLGVKFEIVVRQ